MVYILSSILLFSVSAFAAQLPLLLSKQSLESLRYISDNGRTIYYQSKLGGLFMTKNYFNEPIIELTENTLFVFESTLGDEVLITANDSPHSKMNFLKNYKIYKHKIGNKDALLLGEGRNPQLELDGNWYSYYDTSDKSINFKNSLNNKSFSLKIKNKKNPYFFPDQLMLTENEIIYTDWNIEGAQGLFQYSKLDKKYTLIYKTKFPNSAIEFCKIGTDLYVMERGVFENNNGSQMVKIAIFGNKDFREKEIVYKSRFNDIGNLVCKNDKIYFVKTIAYDKDLNKSTSEVAAFKIANKKVTIISKMDSITQLAVLGNRVLAKKDASYYIVEGENNATKDALDK